MGGGVSSLSWRGICSFPLMGGVKYHWSRCTYRSTSLVVVQVHLTMGVVRHMTQGVTQGGSSRDPMVPTYTPSQQGVTYQSTSLVVVKVHLDLEVNSRSRWHSPGVFTSRPAS